MASRSISTSQTSSGLPSLNSNVRSSFARTRGDRWGGVEGSSFRWEYQMISDRHKVLKFDRRPEVNRPDVRMLSGPLPRFNPYKRMDLRPFRSSRATLKHATATKKSAPNATAPEGFALSLSSAMNGRPQTLDTVSSEPSVLSQQDVTQQRMLVKNHLQYELVANSQLDATVGGDTSVAATSAGPQQGLSSLATTHTPQQYVLEGQSSGHFEATSPFNGDARLPPTLHMPTPRSAYSSISGANRQSVAQNGAGAAPGHILDGKLLSSATAALSSNIPPPSTALQAPSTAYAFTSADSTAADAQASYITPADMIARFQRTYFSPQDDTDASRGHTPSGRLSPSTAAFSGGTHSQSTMSPLFPNAPASTEASSTAPANHLARSPINVEVDQTADGRGDQDGGEYEATLQCLNPEELVDNWFSAFTWPQEGQYQ